MGSSVARMGRGEIPEKMRRRRRREGHLLDGSGSSSCGRREIPDDPGGSFSLLASGDGTTALLVETQAVGHRLAILLFGRWDRRATLVPRTA